MLKHRLGIYDKPNYCLFYGFLLTFFLIELSPIFAQINDHSNKPQTATTFGKLDEQVSKASKLLIKALQEELKTEDLAFTTLAVLPFKALDTGAKKLELASALTELFSTQLSSNGQIMSVERSRIDGVINELNRLKKGEISVKGAAQAGKLLGAKHVLIGSITTIGAELQVTIRLVVSETGVVLAGEMLRAPRKEFVSFHRDVVVTKSKIGAAIRSAIIPGWGQLYNNQKIGAYVGLLGSLASLGTAASYIYLGSMAEAKYLENKRSTVPERQIANEHYSKARIALMSYAAIWTYAIFDSYISGQSDPVIDLKGWVDTNSAGLVFNGEF